MGMRDIDAFFNPASIAVIGVSENPAKLGTVIFRRLLESVKLGKLKAEVYPVNPRLRELDGVRVYSSVSEINGGIDLAVVAIPAQFVPSVIRDFGKKVKTAIVISGGFAESGRRELDEELRRAIKETGVRVLGPNTIGVLDPYSGVNTFFLPRVKTLVDGREAENLPEPFPGNVAIIFQSGALSEMLMDFLYANRVGVRAVACVGNQVDVKIEDFMRYFAEDDLAEVIAVYLEGVEDGRSFLNAAAEASEKKPVVILKAGKTETGRRAAYTHTASIVGNIDVYRGAFKQAGVIEVDSIGEMVDVVKLFSMQKPARGKRLLILTNAGGLAVLSADLAFLKGLVVPELPEGVKKELERLKEEKTIIPIVVVHNPLDLTAQASSEAFEKAYRILASSKLFDLHLLMPSHQPPPVDDTVIDRLAGIALKSGAVVTACELGESEWARIFRKKFDEYGIPAYSELRRAIEALSKFVQYKRIKRGRFPPPLSKNKLEFRNEAGGRPLYWEEALDILREYDINTPRMRIVSDEREAVEAVEELGLPVVLKIYSDEVAHKTDVGGVLVNLRNKEEVLRGYRILRERVREIGVGWRGILIQEMVEGVEILLGSTWDRVFGPTVSVGVGGIYTEILRDFSVRVAPIDFREAEKMLEELRLRRLLEGFRGMPSVDKEALAKLISRFSKIIYENPSLKQFEINPLIASGRRFFAVDVRGFVS